MLVDGVVKMREPLWPGPSWPERHTGWRLAAVVAVIALSPMLLGGGVVKYGRPAIGTTRTAVATGARQIPVDKVPGRRSGIDVNRVVTSIQHRVAAVNGRPGELAATDGAYRATFDANGFGFRPTGAHGQLHVALRSITSGGHGVVWEKSTWRARTNRVERRVAAGMSETTTIRNGEIEWDVVLSRAPRNSGDLTISADVAGATRVVRAGGAVDYRLAGGGKARLGELVVRDASGAVLYRALPTVETGHVGLHVPAAALSRARYPVTIDPTVSAE